MARKFEDSAWASNEAAAQLHQQGLNFEVDQRDFEGAHQAFANAQIVLTHEEQTPDVRLQSARIQRDDGFTSVREMLAGDAASGYKALVTLESAAKTTLALLDQTPADKSRRYKELLSEHGATLGCLGRLAVAQQVHYGHLPATGHSNISRLRRDQRHFGKHEAHRYLRTGSNMYYLVRNAMHGALTERLNGKAAHIAPWLGRAALGLVRAEGKLSTMRAVGQEVVKRDSQKSLPHAVIEGMQRTEFGHSLLTAIRIGSSLRSKSAARKSVITRP